MLAILALGAASGFPNQLTESALQAWLRMPASTNTTIGIMSYVAIPYLLKFLWAPLVDRYPLPLLGRRRGWMLRDAARPAARHRAVRAAEPGSSLVPVAACAAAIVFFSATQDIAIDAYRTDVSLPRSAAGRRGRPTSAIAPQHGWRSAVALLVADYFGWRPRSCCSPD